MPSLPPYVRESLPPPRLEEEGMNADKLMQDKSQGESKVKGLEEQITLHEDNLSKVSQSA